MNAIKFLAALFVLLLLCSCATSNHGTFVSSSYVPPDAQAKNQVLGNVVGESTQTLVLYALPFGPPPSTAAAIADAKQQLKGTTFLTDLSIDDRTYWKLGYSEQVIRVEATAQK